MRKIQYLIFFILFLLAGTNASSQDIDFNVRYNGATDVYEVYARPAFSNPFYFVGGGSQVSILLPAVAADVAVTVVPVNGGLWTDNSQVYAPAADPGNDYHGIASNGAPISFVNGVEILLFTFTAGLDGCTPGVRLFENASDPSSTAPGMGGGDFQMFFANVFDPLNNNWRLNYFNSGLVCPEAPVVIPNPITIPQGGTASTCLPILDLNITDTFTAALCVGSPTNGNSTVSIADRTLCLDYTPDASFVGQDDICILVCDVSGLCDTVSVPVTVIPALEAIPTQAPPVVVVTPITTAQDSTVIVCTTILDHNVGDTFTSSFCGGAQQNGTATATITDNILCLEYVPDTGYTGEDDICVIVCDQAGNCDAVNVPVSVIPTPDLSDIPQNPILVMPPVVTPEDITLTVCGPIIDANVSDLHTVTICAPPVNGTATAAVNDADNSLCITVDPNPNFSGRDSVCVTICDQTALCYTLTVPIEVTPFNDPPLAINDINATQVNNPVDGNVLTNDSDVEGDVLTVNTTVANVTNGTVTIDNLGNYTFTPDTDFIGNGTFQYTVCDDGFPSRCSTADVVIVVTDNANPPNVDNNPVIGVPDHFVMEEGNTLTASVISNDTDPDGDNLTINTTPVTTPANGVVVINPDGTIDYTPTPGYVGDDEFTYEVCDDGVPQSCVTVLVTIVVLEDDLMNDLYATDDLNSGEEGQAQTGNVTDNDYDPEGGILTVNTVPVSDVSNGTVTLNSDGTYSYIPNAGYVGNDQFIYSVCDDGTPTACDMATVYLTVFDAKDAPLVITNPITISADSTGSICMPITDPNPGSTFTFTACATSPTSGTATANIVDGNICVEYTPNLAFTGTDDICLIVCDETGRCDTASIPVTVVPLSKPSTVLEGPAVIITPITVAQDSAVNLCTPIMDQNIGDTFTATFCAGTPENGTATATIIGNTLCLDYTPNIGYIGADDFCINVCDQTGRCDVINVPVSIVPTPKVADTLQAPILVMPPLVTTEDVNATNCGTIIDANVEDTHTVTICEQPANGIAVATVDNTLNSLCIDFDPNANFIGSDSVCVTICDQGALCYTLIVPIEVIPLNDPPLAIDDINNTQKNISTSGNVLTNDTDTDGNNLFVTTTPVSVTDGTVTINAAGVYTFVPDTDFIGDASFEYEVCDDGAPGICDTLTVLITVVDITNPDNNEVIGIPDNFLMEDDLPLTASLVSNDSDPDGDLITINTTPVTTPTNGLLLINLDGTFTYTPTAGFYGVETFSYQICDSGIPQDCDIVPVTITIIEGNGNNNVYATDDSDINEEDATFIGNLVANDNDPEGGLLLTVETTPLVPPTNGTLILSPDGNYIYQPNPNFTGNDQFVYQVCDLGIPSACDSATMYITVLNVSTDIRLNVMLQGALFGSPDSLMRSDLVDEGLVPLEQPYSFTDQPLYASRFMHLLGGNEVTTNEVLTANAGTPDGIVDWVFIEFREALDSLRVIRTVSALVQRDGDVVDAGTGGTVYVDSLPDQFFTVIKHRNHLGAMTAAPLVAVAKVAAFNFITADAVELYNTTPTYNGLEQVTIAGTQALWAGNSNADDRVKYDGTTNDRFIINADVILHPDNTSNTLNFDNATGYFLGDVNMDGKSKYDAISNDRILLQSNVLGYPLNTAFLNNFNLLIEQVK